MVAIAATLLTRASALTTTGPGRAFPAVPPHRPRTGPRPPPPPPPAVGGTAPSHSRLSQRCCPGCLQPALHPQGHPPTTARVCGHTLAGRKTKTQRRNGPRVTFVRVHGLRVSARAAYARVHLAVCLQGCAAPMLARPRRADFDATFGIYWVRGKSVWLAPQPGGRPGHAARSRQPALL